MRDKLIELLTKYNFCPYEADFLCEECEYGGELVCWGARIADILIANGVTFATNNNDGSKGLVDLAAIKKAIKPKADSTLNNMKKADLIDYIRCLENNYNTAVWFNENQARYVESLDLPKWIPVSERLPNVDTKGFPFETIGAIVHVKGIKRSQYRIYERAFVRGKTVYRWKYPWDAISDEEIVEWMPLPEPPKEI